MSQLELLGEYSQANGSDFILVLQELQMLPWNGRDRRIINRVLLYLLIRTLSINVSITFMSIL